MSVTDAGGTYNASAYAATGATVTGVDGSLASFGDGSLSYTYYDVSTSTSLGSAAPTNAGSYTVVAHYAGSTDYTAADGAAVPFSIAQATPSVSVTDAGGTYNASPYPATGATVTGVDGTLASFGDGSLSYTYYDVSTSTSLGSAAPTNAGSYTVVATYAGSTDYTAADSAAVPFSIAQATPSVSVTDAGGTYNASAFAATAPRSRAWTARSPASAIAACPTPTTMSRLPLRWAAQAPTNAGSYTVVATTPAARTIRRPTARQCPSASAKPRPA